MKRSLQKREKGTFFAVTKRSYQKSKKGTFFAVGSDVLVSAKKEPLRINGVFKLYLKAVSNPTD